jgi:hypothetical protein
MFGFVDILHINKPKEKLHSKNIYYKNKKPRIKQKKNLRQKILEQKKTKHPQKKTFFGGC